MQKKLNLPLKQIRIYLYLPKKFKGRAPLNMKYSDLDSRFETGGFTGVNAVYGQNWSVKYEVSKLEYYFLETVSMTKIQFMARIGILNIKYQN